MTSEQESILEQLIQSYINAKRLSELPDATSSNPFDFWVEVLENGVSKKANLAVMLPYMESQCAYGVEYDVTISSPSCTRIGNADLHRTLPIQSRMRGCLLNDNGEVVRYLNPDNWQGEVRDGSVGQVMVEIPQHYCRFVTDGNKRRVLLSEYPLPGYTSVRKMYVSAYEASIQHSTGKLSSVVNNSTDYRGGDNSSTYDGYNTTLLGKPVTNMIRSELRSAARLRNTQTNNWNIYTYDCWRVLYWLYVVEYANLNVQDTYTAQLDSNGYHQGGLGDGVTTINSSAWGTYNARNPLIDCGSTDSLGNRTGVVSVVKRYNDDVLFSTFSVPRYRGIENPFGHIDKIIDGCNVYIAPDVSQGGTGYTNIFASNDTSSYNDNNMQGYNLIGNMTRSNGYITALLFGECGDIIPISASGGSSTSYMCDNVYSNAPTDYTKITCINTGGRTSSGAQSGLSSILVMPNVSTRYTYIGTRLCYINN